MKRVFAPLLVILMVVCIFPLVGCGCEHEWEDATCTKPKICSKCGETEGEALGHIPGEIVLEDADLVGGTVMQRQYCVVCEAELSNETVPLDTYISDGVLLLDSDNFTERLNIILETVAKEEDREPYIAKSDVGFDDDGIHVLIGILDGSGECQALIMPNDGKSMINISNLKVFIRSDKLLPSAIIYRSMIMTCDPLCNYDMADYLGGQLLSRCSRPNSADREVTENGIVYDLEHNADGGFTLSISILG